VVTVGLCLLALICVILGLARDSAGWLLTAVVVTAFALAALVRRRGSARRSYENDASGPADVFDADTVWVVDGRPRYHQVSCVLVKEWDAEAIPRPQAVADGFVPCAVCRPDDEELAA
jgi:hypothetical protein